MEEYKPGERLRVSVEGVVRHAGHGVVHLTYGDESIPAADRAMLSIVLDQPGVTVERLVPAEGMPADGELWETVHGIRVLVCADRGGGVYLTDGVNTYTVYQLLKQGSLTPLYRNPGPTAEEAAFRERLVEAGKDFPPMGDVGTHPEAWPVDKPEPLPIGGVTPDAYVQTPDWHGGAPVRVLSVQDIGDGQVAVRYQDAGGHYPAVLAHVAEDFPVTPAAEEV